MRYGPADSSQTPRFTGARTFMRLPSVETTQNVDVAVIGIPTDDAVSYKSGARFGPEGIRSASALLRPYNPEQFSVGGVVGFASILLLTRDPYTYPPYRARAVKKFLKLVGWEDRGPAVRQLRRSPTGDAERSPRGDDGDRDGRQDRQADAHRN